MLIYCKECEQECSDRAKRCPHCGCPLAAPSLPRKVAARFKTTRAKVALVAAVVAIGILIFTTCNLNDELRRAQRRMRHIQDRETERVKDERATDDQAVGDQIGRALVQQDDRAIGDQIRTARRRAATTLGLQATEAQTQAIVEQAIRLKKRAPSLPFIEAAGVIPIGLSDSDALDFAILTELPTFPSLVGRTNHGRQSVLDSFQRMNVMFLKSVRARVMPESQDRPNYEGVAVYSAQELHDTFHTDAIRANKVFKGALLAVKGAVTFSSEFGNEGGIEEGALGTVVLDGAVLILFDDPKSAAGLAIGQEVVIAGKCDRSVGGKVALTDCVIGEKHETDDPRNSVYKDITP